MPYLRKFPWFLQLFLFIMLLLVIGSVTTYAVKTLLPLLTGFSLEQAILVNENSSYAQVRAGLIAQGAVHAGIFLIPCLLFAYITHPRPAYYLGIRKPGKPIHWLLVLLITIAAMPVMMGLASMLQSLHIKWADDAQRDTERLEKAFFNMPSFAAFAGVFFIMAILPAFGEEFLFRGILMRIIKKRSRNMVFPILVTTLMFALVHGSAYNFIPIIISGILLGTIYYFTGSILCSILFHLFNNGLQIIAVYMGQGNPALKAVMESNTIPAYVFITGIVALCFFVYMLWKNRTPLPANWADDYTPQELEAEKQELP